MNSPFLLYSSTSGELLPREPLAARIKQAVIAETNLIAANAKVFLALVSVIVIGAADTITDANSAGQWTFTGALLVAIAYLVREIAKRDKKIEQLYDRLSRREKEDDRRRRSRGDETEPLN